MTASSDLWLRNGARAADVSTQMGESKLVVTPWNSNAIGMGRANACRMFLSHPRTLAKIKTSGLARVEGDAKKLISRTNCSHDLVEKSERVSEKRPIVQVGKKTRTARVE